MGQQYVAMGHLLIDTIQQKIELCLEFHELCQQKVELCLLFHEVDQQKVELCLLLSLKLSMSELAKRVLLLCSYFLSLSGIF